MCAFGSAVGSPMRPMSAAMGFAVRLAMFVVAMAVVHQLSLIGSFEQIRRIQRDGP